MKLQGSCTQNIFGKQSQSRHLLRTDTKPQSPASAWTLCPGKGRRLLSRSVLLLGVMLVQACQLIPSPASRAEVAAPSVLPAATQRSETVAQDLVDALRQIPESAPSGQVYVIASPHNDFGRVLARELQRAGYDLRLGEPDGHQTHIAYTIRTMTEEGASAEYEFSLLAGAVGVKRRYALAENRVYPVSSMLVLGGDASQMVVDDARFTKQPQSGVQLAAVELQEALPVVQKQPKKNMYLTRRSNFADVTAGYEKLVQSILVFPNDSLMMGRNNKQLLRDMMSQFDDQTDLVSVIGCSHGKTSLNDGNRRLAQGRAARVKDELTALGIDESLILDEACWANVHFDEMMPRRGVVLTIRRQKASDVIPG